MVSPYTVILLLNLLLIECGDGWRAVPANQAMYAVRSRHVGKGVTEIPDELLPRTTLHSTYKFGYCTPEITQRQFLRSTVNVSFESYQDSHSSYLYILSDLHTTRRWKLQCIVMKFFVPLKYSLRRSRIPMYYCQGQVFIMVFDSVQRLAIHEFYMQSRLNMPVDIFFEFYHPNIL